MSHLERSIIRLIQRYGVTSPLITNKIIAAIERGEHLSSPRGGRATVVFSKEQLAGLLKDSR
jgi:hypothetical protein